MVLENFVAELDKKYSLAAESNGKVKRLEDSNAEAFKHIDAKIEEITHLNKRLMEMLEKEVTDRLSLEDKLVKYTKLVDDYMYKHHLLDGKLFVTGRIVSSAEGRLDSIERRMDKFEHLYDDMPELVEDPPRFEEPVAIIKPIDILPGRHANIDVTYRKPPGDYIQDLSLPDMLKREPHEPYMPVELLDNREKNKIIVDLTQEEEEPKPLYANIRSRVP